MSVSIFFHKISSNYYFYYSASDIIIDTDGELDGSGQGFVAGNGPGVGYGEFDDIGGSGASHGGTAGQGSVNKTTSPAYGNVLFPTDFGSGGYGEVSVFVSGTF